MPRQLLQPRLKTNIAGGTGHVQPSGNYSHKNITGRGGANGITIGDSTTLFGYRTTNDPTPFGALNPDRMPDDDQFVYSIYSDTSNDLIVIQFGDAGDEQHLTWNGIALTILEYGSTVTLFWNATNLRYEVNDAALTAWMSTNVGVTSGGGLQDASVNVIAVARPIDFVTPNSIIVYGDAFSIAWGDGNGFIPYADGEIAESVAGDLIYVASDAGTQIRFLSDTFDEIVVEAATMTTFQGLCDGSTKLLTFNANNTQNVTIFSRAWYGCSGLTSVPELDTSAGLYFADTWRGCSGLTSVPALDTSSGTLFTRTFGDCTSLKCLSSINTLLQTDTTDMFISTPVLAAPDATEQAAILSGSNYVNANACPLPVPGTPTGLTVTAGTTASSELVTSWTASTGIVDGYKVFRNGVEIADITALTYTDTGLASGTTYSYTVSAYNSSGSSAQHAPVDGTTDVAPPFVAAVPLDFVATNQITITGGDFQIDWGDGNFISYLAGETAESIATGNITITTNAAPTGIVFNSDTYTEIDIGDATSLTSFNSICYGLTNLVSFIANNTQNVTDFFDAWRECSGLTSFPLIDTSSGIDFSSTWRECSGLTSFPLIDTSSGTDFGLTWFSCSGLTTFPLIDTSNGTKVTNTWANCSSLTSFPLIDTSKSTSVSNAWQNCSSLTSFPLIDTSTSTIFSFAWDGCSGLTSFPLIDTSNASTLAQAWQNCSSLTSFPAIDTSTNPNFALVFNGCTSLVCISSINTLTATNTFDMFANTPALVNPTAAEQTSIITVPPGLNYINANACP